jgi:hypothetical protein
VNPFNQLRKSFDGWADIVSGKPTAPGHFDTGRGGFIVALGWLVVAVLFSIAAQSAAIGLPPLSAVLQGLVTQVLTFVALGLVIAQTLRFLRRSTPLLALLVPIVYALAYVFVLAVPLTLIGPNAALIAMAGLALLLFRAARVLAGLPTATSIAFAVLCVIVLVVVPNALYIVLSPSTSPA